MDSASTNGLQEEGVRWDRALVATEHFDTAYYLANNPDVAAAGVDPVVHFLDMGWREGRNPSRCFDVSYYLRSNPDVASSGINPLVHFVSSGSQEGRLPRRPLDAWRRQLDAAVPPCQRGIALVAEAEPAHSITAGEIVCALAAAATDGIAISVSHDDYVINTGGVQIVIEDERRAFERAHWAYLHVSPAAPRPMLAALASADQFFVALRFNGERLGVTRFSELLDSVSDLSSRGVVLECVVHHLMGHAPELVLQLIRMARVERPTCWAHDLFHFCPSFAMMRNDIAFCGAPVPDSPACRICCYGDARRAHLDRVEAFFKDAVPWVLCPSETALRNWRQSGALPHAEAAVVSPARLLTVPFEPNRRHGPTHPIRVAYLGVQAFHKGWPVFEELALSLENDTRYVFFQLGLAPTTLPGSIRNVPVRVDRHNRNAMIDAMVLARIDVVIIWSFAPESFCLTAHEALAAGAFIVANLGPGNVWPAVLANAPDQGCTIGDVSALHSLFESDELECRLQAASFKRGALVPSGGAADWVLTKHRRALRTRSPVMRFQTLSENAVG